MNLSSGNLYTQDTARAIAEALAGRGYAVIPGFFADSLMADLRADLKNMAPSLQVAGTGRNGAMQAAPQLAPQLAPVRTDRTLWLDGSGTAQKAYLAQMESLRLALNEAMFMGLFDYECHYALYQPGGFYKKHVDSLHGARNRLVSCVTYLTPGWADSDAGHLVLYAPDDENREIARILPQAGTLAIFLSEEIPHEVLPPARDRASIAGWYRCNSSSGHRADPQK